MKNFILFIAIIAMMFAGCDNKHAEEHPHESAGLEPLAYTLYSDTTEIFVEFKPLVVGSKSSFAAHFTILGENFLPLTQGSVTVSLNVDGSIIRDRADTASSPGIFRLELIPQNAGTGTLYFDIKTDDYTDRIVIENVYVHPDLQTALNKQRGTDNSDDITFLKEQAWKVEFANAPVLKQPFSNIIKTNGQILSAPGDEMIVTASANGSVLFSGSSTIIGSEVSRGANLFTITGGSLTGSNIDVAYKEAKTNFEKAKADYERASELVKDNIISQKDFLQAKVAYENAQTAFNVIAKNYSAKGQRISSPIAGFIKNILIEEGQYVDAGTPLAIISKNKNLILQAYVSQRYFNELSTITSANFKTIGSDTVFNTQEMNGKIISFGKSATANSPFIPITFEIDNIGNIIPGSVAEVYLKSSAIQDALIVPTSSLMEEQGNFYVYIQSGGESFQKREVKLGASDGLNVQVLSGVTEGERVVTKGAYQIKLASASGELPAHGHEH